MRPDAGKPYYTAYDERYQAAYQQGADHWGHLQLEKEVNSLISGYVNRFKLAGKRVVEFGCGDGWIGKLFAGLGCIYEGYDISPVAVEKAKVNLGDCLNAQALVKDVVLDELPSNVFDAGVEVQFIHILITDKDRKKYLQNVYRCLKPGSLFYLIHDIYRDDAYEGVIDSYEQWLKLTSYDVETPQLRTAYKKGAEIPVFVPLIAARARTERDYRKEMEEAGLEVLEFMVVEDRMAANILVRKQ
jgi:SAM-dependent methyltransferase